MSTTHRFPHSLKFCFSSLVRSHFTSFQLFLSSHTQIKSEKRAQVDWARQWVRFYFFRRRFKRSISKSEIVTCFGAFMCDIVGRRRHGRTQNETNVGIDSFFRFCSASLVYENFLTSPWNSYLILKSKKTLETFGISYTIEEPQSGLDVCRPMKKEFNILFQSIDGMASSSFAF